MRERFLRSTLLLSALVAAVAFAAPSAAPQCLVGPDGLDIGNCCQPTTPNLPNFPGAQPPGLGICYSNCGAVNTQDLRVQWTTPVQTGCAQYITTLTVSDAGTGVPLLSGPMTLDYTRTWDETDTLGNAAQVWRMVAKADLSVLTPGAVGSCLIPPCLAPAGPWQSAFFYGYADYENCDFTTPFENALVLFHACDDFIHKPGISDKPGSFHPGRSYAIVAPHSAVQPFVPTPIIAPGGPLTAEATRNVIAGGPCIVEDKIANGNMNPLGAGCVCAFTNNPKQQTLRELRGVTQCPTPVGPGNFTSVKMPFPAFPWFHMVTTSIGRWTSPFSYPGQEETWVDEGLFALQDACSGDFAEFKYGGTTRGGWDAVLSSGVTPESFTDLADNYTAPLFGPYPGPFVGSNMPTDHLLYVNTP